MPVCLCVCVCVFVYQVSRPLQIKSGLNANAAGKREVKQIPGQGLSGKKLGYEGQGGRDCRRQQDRRRG